MLAIEGEGYFGVGGKVYRCEPGTVFLLDKNEPHDSGCSHYQGRSRSLWLYFESPEQVTASEVFVRPRMLRDREWSRGLMFHPIIEPDEPLRGPWLDVLMDSWNACSADHSSGIATGRLKAAVIGILLDVWSRRKIMGALLDESSAGSMAVRQVQLHIQEHLDDKLSLTALSEIAGYEPHYFHRLFRRHTGKPMGRYIKTARLSQAKQLLFTGLRVQVVAQRLGFGSPHYFSRFFKQFTGRSPLAWVARHSGRKHS